VQLLLEEKVEHMTERQKELHEHNEALYQRLSYDHLTGIHNLAAFQEKGAEYFEAFRTHNQSPKTVIALDLDGFKGANDTFGHDEGDRALKTFAEFLQQRLRVAGSKDFVARKGGDEFAIIFDGTEQAARDKLNALREEFAKEGYKTQNGDITFLSFSFGAHQFDITDADFADAFKKADTNCYIEKDAIFDRETKQYVQTTREKAPDASTIFTITRDENDQVIPVTNSKLERTTTFYKEHPELVKNSSDNTLVIASRYGNPREQAEQRPTAVQKILIGKKTDDPRAYSPSPRSM